MYGGHDRRGMRKPLIVFTPKSLLRHPRAVSTLHDFTSRRLPARSWAIAGGEPDRVTRVVFCSGKIYYDLLAAREERKADHVALVRVEQLYPFAADQAADILARYPVTAEVVWAQEEPRNMGAGASCASDPAAARSTPPRESATSAARKAPAPPPGRGKRHQQEQAEIVNDALTPGAISQTSRVRVVARRKK